MYLESLRIPWELLRYSISTPLAPRPGLMFNNGPRIAFSCEYIYLLRKKTHRYWLVDSTEGGVTYLPANVNVQRWRIGRWAHGLLWKMSRWTSWLRTVLRGRFVPHTRPAYVPVIRNFLAVWPGRRTDARTIPKYIENC